MAKNRLYHKIRELIRNDQFHDALELMDSLCNDDIDNENTVLIYQSDLIRIEKTFKEHTISFDDFMRHLTRLKLGALETLEEICK